nr:MAG TPA: hypothetical protein [Caudoviricetes sp.]
MKNERQITFAHAVESHLIGKAHYVRHVRISTLHTAEIYTRNYSQLVFALDVARTCCMVMKKAVLSVGQNQPKPCQSYVLLTLKNTTSDKKYGEKHDTKKTRKTAYVHAVAKGKQVQDIALAHFVEKQ